MRTHTVIDSVVGPLTIVAEDGAIACLYMDLQRHRPGDDELGEPDPRGREAEPFKSAADQLDAYFAGELTTFALPLAPRGSEFQQRVWAALQEIPYGQTESYGELAERIGSPVPPVRWAWRTGGTPSESSSRATGSSGLTAVSPATAEVSTASGSC